MKENQHVTPETGKLLEEAGLIKLGSTLFAWYRIIRKHGDERPETEWELIYWPNRVANYDKWEYIPAPTLGEIWELLPESIKVQDEDELMIDCYLIVWNKKFIAYKGGFFEQFYTTSILENPADAAGRLLLQLHKDGKL